MDTSKGLLLFCLGRGALKLSARWKCALSTSAMLWPASPKPSEQMSAV